MVICKVILMQCTIDYINALVIKKIQEAIDRAEWINSHEIEVKEGYLILN